MCSKSFNGFKGVQRYKKIFEHANYTQEFV